MITLNELTKTYGPTTAVDGLSVDIRAGQVTGFLGPNGAGKSTTMRMILGLDRPTSGTALIDGRAYTTFAHPLREVGAVLDARAVHPGRSGRNHLLAMARSNGIPRTRVDAVLETVGLESVASRRAGTYSLGMNQRLGIAGALLGDPQVLLFDEPVNGLDPEGVHWIRELIRGLAAEGRTVLVSSHLMSEMQDTADQLLIIGRGRLIADAPVDEVIAGSSRTGALVRAPQADALGAYLRDHGLAVEQAADHELIVTGGSLARIGDLALAAGIPVHELSPRLASLEQAYLELTADSVEYATHTSTPGTTITSIESRQSA